MLDAALELFGRSDGPPVTTERIAELAEVSAATVYNLVGTREQLLIALVDRLIGDLVASVPTEPPDPLTALRAVIAGSVEVLTARPTAYRRVVLELTAAASAAMHTKLSPAVPAAAAIRHAQAKGMVRDDLDPDALAAQVYLSYNGALLRWAAGALTDAGFRAAALHGLVTVLAASATSRSRSSMLAELRQLGAELRPPRSSPAPSRLARSTTPARVARPRRASSP